jgi:hypothetical protein
MNNDVLTIQIGDRVKVKSQDTPADVTAISEDGKYYTVKFVQPVREFWTGDPMQTATYDRYGITRNYDRMTGEEIIGNATYYAEQLKYGIGSIIDYELAGVTLRTESTREDVEPDSREGWGNEYRVTIRHKTGDTCETMTLQECAELLARLYTESGGNMSHDFIENEEENSEQADTLTEAEKRDTLYRLWDAAWEKAQDEPKELRVIVETNEADPSAPKNEFGRYYMIDKADGCGNVYDRWQVIRVDIVKSPYEVHRPNYAAANGYADDQAQICIEVENKNNIVRWARLMIDAGRVTDIYADCY